MAIYHLSAKVVSRGKGQSAIAAAAYRSGDPLVDERTGELKSYEKRSLRIIHKEIMAPAHSPAWARDRNALWNAAERAEKRKDAQLAREIEVSLPHELTEQQRLHLIKDFAREAFVRRGYAVDISIHTPDRGADGRNHHAHLMITMRVLGPDGFAPMKDRSLNATEQLDAWRAQWANLANRHLARHGHEARIDHRSLETQGIEREATTHIGYAGGEIAARGGQSDRMDEHSAIVERNGVRTELRAADAELAQLRELVANENRQRRQAPPQERRTRTMQDGPTDDELKRQPAREATFLAHMQKEHQRAEAILAERQRAQDLDSRAQAFQQAKAQEAEEGKKRQAERDETENRDGRNGDIGSAAARYSIALGQCYDVRDPYASLARAAGAEAAAFHRGQEALRAQAAAAKTPEQRQAIELRRRIEGCDYMAITSDRLAGISVAVTGRSDSGQAVADRQQAAHWRAQAVALRSSRSALLEAVQARTTSAREPQASAARGTAAGLDDRRVAQPAATPANAAAQPAARLERVPEPRREHQAEQGSTTPPSVPEIAPKVSQPASTPAPERTTAPEAAQPAAAEQTEPSQELVQLNPQPFRAVAPTPHAVTMEKTAEPAKDADKVSEVARAAVERALSPEPARFGAGTHSRSAMPATVPEPEAQNAAAGKGEKGKGERTGEAASLPAPKRNDYRSLLSEVPEPRVVERDGRDAGTLSEFLKREQPHTSEPRVAPTPGQLLRNNALLGEHQRHKVRMQDEAQNADKALGRIGSDLEHRRPVQADDLRSLTREQWDHARTKGEAGLSQTVREAKDRGAQGQGREMTATTRKSGWEP